jgi:hypothetical protein
MRIDPSITTRRHTMLAQIQEMLRAYPALGCLAVVIAIGLIFLATGGKKANKASPSHDIIPGLVSMHQAYEGIVCIAGPGAGKTTGPLAEIALNLLRHPSKPGMLILCAKPDEAARWRYYCEYTGRGGDYIHFAPGKQSCDVISYELSQPGATIGGTSQLIDALVKRESQGQSAAGDNPFWPLFAERITRCAIGAIWMGEGRSSLLDIQRFVAAAPKSKEQEKDPDWRAMSFCYRCLTNALARYSPEDIAANRISRDLAEYQNMWLREWPMLSSNTRSIGETMVQNITSKFIDGPLAPMVASDVDTATPGDVLDGKILVLDMPALIWHSAGVNFQIIMKTLVQRAALRRDPATNPRPVIIWADEAQFFVVPSTDMMVSTVSRQSRLISVVAAQNLEMLYTALGGGDKARQEVNGWLSCYMTKIIGANLDNDTNRYFSELCGNSWQDVWSGSGGTGGQYDVLDDLMGKPMKGGPSMSWQPNWRPDVPPEVFPSLQKGGAPNYTVETILLQGGRTFDNGKVWTRAYFPQCFPPSA